jgi:hypothetical protein
MLALSDEGGSTVEKMIEELGMVYPVAAGSGSKRAYGVSGIPSAFLIDHEGTIIWQGHPSGNGWVELLPEALARAEAMADQWDPGERAPELEKAVEAARAGEMTKTWKETDALLRRYVEDAAVLEKVEAFRKDFLARAALRTAQVEGMTAEGRYFEAQGYLERQSALYRGTPPAEEWDALVSNWKKDREIKELLALDKKRMQALQKAREGDKDKASKDLYKLIEKAEGTLLEAAMRAAYTLVGAM